jgi:short-subunit dehydrogenase
VTDEASVNAMIAAVLSRTGRIDVLVNNAGLGLMGGAEESSIAQVQALFDVNVYGVMRLTNAVLPIMRQGGAGRIINISSVLGLIPAPYSAHYSATKHALEGGVAGPRSASLQCPRQPYRARAYAKCLRAECSRSRLGSA